MNLVRPSKVKPRMWAPGRVRMGHPLARGLVGYWPFWEGGSDRLMDSSGNANHGNIVSGTWQSGPMGYELGSFSGTDVITVDKLLALPQTYNFTAMLWASADASGATACALSWGGTDDLLFYPYATIPVGFRIFWRDLGIASSTLAATHALAGTGPNQFVLQSLAADDHRIFINGQLVDTASNTGTAGPFSTLRIGGWSDSSQPFHGEIQQVTIWDRALSLAEIQELYEDPFGLIRPPSAMSLFSIGAVGAAPPAGITRLVGGRGLFSLAGNGGGLAA